VLLTLILWFIGALIFAYYLATFANYAATYAGLASVMIVLIFLYMIGVIFIIGAELNAALLKFRVRAIFSHNFLSGQGQKPSKPDEVANIVRRDASGS
jgi:membrane protein